MAEDLVEIYSSVMPLHDIYNKGFIFKIFRIIMEKDPEEHYRGNTKQGVYITGKVPKFPPSGEWLEENFEDKLKIINEHHPYGNIFKKHVAFESMHPFDDGNGRVGRALLFFDILSFLGYGLMFSDKIAENRDDYYRALDLVRKEPNKNHSFVYLKEILSRYDR
jgi:Fic family protein